MGTLGAKIITGSTFAAAGAMVAVEEMLPGMATPTPDNFAGIITVTIAAVAGGWFASKALAAKLGVKGWLLLGPLYFALVGFGLWASCLSATYFLSKMTNAKPSISFFEFLGGLFTHGYSYALLGLVVGLIWSIPVAASFVAMALRQFFVNQHSQSEHGRLLVR